MTCTPDTPARGWRMVLVAGFALAAAGALHAAAPSAKDLIDKAQAALDKQDGVAAEVRLREAMEAGATRDRIAARMGEAFIDQGDTKSARDWLGEAKFAPGDEGRGYRMLGMLERIEGNLPAAAQAYDEALSFTPKDASLWVDIGRLRYTGGAQVQAKDAVDRALAIDPANVRALEFRAQLVRDQYGLRAAIPWFEAALEKAPDDLSLLGEYAATLGEFGRAKDMLTVTRRMIDIDADNPRAFFLQAVLAARAGKAQLARSLFERTQGKLRDIPAAMLLDGAINLEAGNTAQAIEALDRLCRIQPSNLRAQMLLARAMADAGQWSSITGRFGDAAARRDATPYLMTLVARAYEEQGQRDLAAPLLDRAAAAGFPQIEAINESQPIGVLAVRWRDAPGLAGTAVPYIRALLVAGQTDTAANVAEKLRADNPGAGDAWALAGDVQFARGDVAAAIPRYEMAARVRLDGSLLVRLVEAYNRAGKGAQAAPVIEGFLYSSPQDRNAVRLAAVNAGQAGDWPRARLLLERLRASGGGRDVRMLADLAFAQMKAGDPLAAEATARSAYAIQRSSAVAAQAWGTTLVASHGSAGQARALLEKARVMGGDNPMLAEVRKQLAGLDESGKK